MAPNRYYSSTAVETTVSAPISSGAGSVQVAAITGFPTSTPFTIVFEVGTSNEEIAEVTNVAGTTFTINRGVDGSSALSHTTGAKVVHGVSARDFREPQEHLGGTVGVHGLGGSTAVVGTDTAQTLTNKIINSPTINTPTIATPAITGGTWTGTPSLNAPSISNPAITGGGSWAGSPAITSPTITAPTINTGGTWNGSPTLVTPTIASFINAGHDHSAAASGGNVPQASITGLNARLTNIESLNTTQDGRLTTAEGNITTIQTPAYVVLYHSLSQSIPDSTVTAVQWNREAFKSVGSSHNNAVNPSRFIAPTTGVYLVIASIPWNINATGLRELLFQVNGSVSWAGDRRVASGSVTIVQTISHMIPLTAGDYVEALVWQNSGSSIAIDNTYATGQRFEAIFMRSTP